MRKGKTSYISIRCDVNRNVNTGDIFRFELEYIEARTQPDGSDVRVNYERPGLPGSQIEINKNGSVIVSLSLETPDSQQILPGSQKVVVGAFRISTRAEPIRIQELGVLLDMDADAHHLIKNAYLLYENGSPVLKHNGNVAKTSFIGDILFEDLDFIIDQDDAQILKVAFDIREEVNMENVEFKIALNMDENVSELRGENSGSQLTDGYISVEEEYNGDRTYWSNTMYLQQN